MKDISTFDTSFGTSKEKFPELLEFVITSPALT